MIKEALKEFKNKLLAEDIARLLESTKQELLEEVRVEFDKEEL
jgi:hypothetical protein